jgi:hypothetical protein
VLFHGCSNPKIQNELRSTLPAAVRDVHSPWPWEPGMAVFLVSFDIRYDATYQHRYSSFIKEVQKTSPWWADSTTFIAVQTDETIDDFCSRIYLKSDFDALKDRFLVLDANVMSGRVKGAITDQDHLLQLLPFVTKLETQ